MVCLFSQKSNWTSIFVLLSLTNICFFGFVVYSVSLRQQLQDVGKKLVGAQHYNKDGSVNNRQVWISC